MYSCQIFLTSCASVRSILFVLYVAHLCMKCSLGISNSLEEISILSHSIVFLYLFALVTEEGFLISPCFSLELCIQMGISFLFSFAFSFFLFSAIFKAYSDNHFVFLHFFFLEMILITASCTTIWTSVHSSSGTLSDLIPWIYLSLVHSLCHNYFLKCQFILNDHGLLEDGELSNSPFVPSLPILMTQSH